MKYHYSHRFFTYSVKRKAALGASILALSVPSRDGARSALKTVSGGEFGWGGTSVKE